MPSFKPIPGKQAFKGNIKELGGNVLFPALLATVRDSVAPSANAHPMGGLVHAATAFFPSASLDRRVPEHVLACWLWEGSL